MEIPILVEIWTDGSAQPNPGHAGYGFHARFHDRVIDCAGYIGEATNNVAEYTAVLMALRMAAEEGASAVQLYADSKLVVEQVMGRWKVRDANLRTIHGQIKEARGAFGSVRLTHVYREQNGAADALSKEAVETRKHSIRRELKLT